MLKMGSILRIYEVEGWVSPWRAHGKRRSGCVRRGRRGDLLKERLTRMMKKGEILGIKLEEREKRQNENEKEEIGGIKLNARA